ncbi:hypothetical protein AB0H57_06520 [Micromonospora sp. NPDC050686]|uniref:hypothetical protein n=1 Tax=Micromonospora sp. NPDC050686 TaxID=3154631 RepID=UPI0033F6A683
MNLATTPRTLSAALRRAPRALLASTALLLAVGAAGCAASPTGTTAARPSTALGATATATAMGGAAPAVTASRPLTVLPAAARTVSWPLLTWYTPQRYAPHAAPARIWRQTPAGKWQLVRQGMPGVKGSLSNVAVSPDGRRATWLASAQRRLVIDRFTGGAKRTVPVANGPACEPSWLDNLRVVYAQGREGDWTYLGVNADGTGRRVFATHQKSCPTVAGTAVLARYDARTVTLFGEGGPRRTVKPRIPAGLKIHGVAGVSGDGRNIVISTHVPSPGECACGWRIRNYRVSMATGAAVELAPLDRAWRKPTGRGLVEKIVFLRTGGLVAQTNAAMPGDDSPRYRLVRYGTDGRVVGSRSVPAGDQWASRLLG